MATPYERGKKDGVWTRRNVVVAGFDSAQACLTYQEQVYVQDMKALVDLPAEHRERQGEYLRGIMEATRASLTALIEQEESGRM